MTIALSVVIPSRGDRSRAVATFHALTTQRLPDEARRQVTIVFDGVDDTVESVLPAIVSDDLQIIELTMPRGRSGARNVGAAASQGDVLLFMDADCVPDGPDFLMRLLAAFSDPGVVAAGGGIHGIGAGFWSHYQADASRRRDASPLAAGPPLTAANLAIRRSAFERCRGFDEGYRYYGFEDRDLLLRLAELGQVVRVPGVSVVHEDALSLEHVARKLCEAGATTSSRFARLHADAYRALGYAALDSQLHPWLRLPGILFGPLAMHAAARIEPLLHRRWVPYSLAKTLVRLVGALAFLYGSTRRQADSTAA